RSSFRSTDGGATWVPFNTGLSRGEGYAFATQPTGTVYFADVFGDVHRLATRTSGIDQFRCFKAKGRPFVAQAVDVSDRLGDTGAVALGRVRLCVPTSFGGEPITNADAALMCYRLTRGSFTEIPFSGFLSNRVDGYLAFDARDIDSLCVP